MKTITAIFYLFCICLVHAGPSTNLISATLTWNYDFVNNSGVTNFTVYYGTNAGPPIPWNGSNIVCSCYQNQLNTGLSTNVVINGLQRTLTYYFAATATDTNGLTSDYSNEARLISTNKPAPPFSLNVH